jgi:hypothetical protein
MRQSLAAQTSLAVLLWFFAAPFLHLHAADAEDHSHEETGHGHDAIVHFHTPDRHAVGEDVEASAAREDEKPLDSFAIVQRHAAILALPFVTAARVETPRPLLDSAEPMVVPYTPQAHDPPDLRASGPRAPPA